MLGSCTWIMKTNVAKAPNTKSTRLRMSGTSSAARRLFSTEPLFLSRCFAVRGRRRLFENRTRGVERFARAVRKEHVAEPQPRRQRLSSLRAAQNLDAVAFGFDLLCDLERLRRYFHRRVPVRQVVQIDDRELRAEMPDVARLLRVAAAMRQTALPWCLAALTAGLDHTRTVPAPDASALGPAALRRAQCAQRHARAAAGRNCRCGHHGRLFRGRFFRGSGLRRGLPASRLRCRFLLCHRFFQCRGYAAKISPAVLPRIAATCSAVLSDLSASTVAYTTLIGLLVPSDLVRMSWMPASSKTARIAPPAITPVPGAAGLSSTRAAPMLWLTWCGIVFSTIGTVTRFFLAASTALRIASGTSPAFPIAKPTRPFRSPTTTSALKLKRLPPLTTFATRLTRTTVSSNPELSRSRPPRYCIRTPSPLRVLHRPAP